MDAKSRPKINIHGHLLLDPSVKGDIPTRIRRWQDWNVQYFCCLCASSKPSSRGPWTFENHHFLKAKKQYGDILIGFADWTGGSGRKPHIRQILSALLPHPALETNRDDPEENLALQSLPQFCFGTDNPEPDRWVEPGEMILDRLHATDEIKQRFYYNNAARMLGMPEI